MPARRRRSSTSRIRIIGTFKLVKVVENMREQIVALGGEIRFARVVTLIEDGPEGRALARTTALDQRTGERSGARRPAVMAFGHSSRDTFEMPHERGVHIEAALRSASVSSIRRA